MILIHVDFASKMDLIAPLLMAFMIYGIPFMTFVNCKQWKVVMVMVMVTDWGQDQIHWTKKGMRSTKTHDGKTLLMSWLIIKPKFANDHLDYVDKGELWTFNYFNHV